MLTSSQLRDLPEDALDITGQPASLLSRKHQFVRGAIWDAAIDLFAKKGFDETTIDEIAQAAGVSRRSFFRYFSSKNDLMGENMVLYAKTLTEAIAAFPATYSLLEVMRQTVLQVARGAAAKPRTRKIMQIAAHNPAAREAQLSRLAEVQDRVAEAFARRSRKRSADDLTSRVLAGATMSIFDVTFRSWFERDHQDISVPAEQAFAALHRLFCEETPASKQGQGEPSAPGGKRKRNKD